MKKLFYLLLVVLILSPLLLIFLCLDNQPLVPDKSNLASNDIQRIRQLVAELRDPQPGQSLVLGETELNHFVQYGLDKASATLPSNGQVVLTSEQGGALLLTADTGFTPRPFINLVVQFYSTGNDIQISSVHLGSLAIPPTWVYRIALSLAPRGSIEKALAQWQGVRQTIHSITINDAAAAIEFIDTPDLKQQLQRQQVALLIGDEVMELLPLYRDKLQQRYLGDSGRKLSLADAMHTVFSFSATRTAQGLDAVNENTAAILALALNAASDEVLEMVGLNIPIDNEQGFIPTLQGRFDLARHFLTAAVLTIYTDGDTANLAGVVKELEDVHRATGFSVSDLIADHAGVQFAKLATAPNSAPAVSQRLQEAFEESYFFPGKQALGQPATDSLLASAQNGDEQTVMKGLEKHIYQLIDQLPIYQDM